MLSTSLVGRTGGAAAADVEDELEVDVDRGGHIPPVPQARSVGQHPPPIDAGQELKPDVQVSVPCTGVETGTGGRVSAVTTAVSVFVGKVV